MHAEIRMSQVSKLNLKVCVKREGKKKITELEETSQVVSLK